MYAILNSFFPSTWTTVRALRPSVAPSTSTFALRVHLRVYRAGDLDEIRPAEKRALHYRKLLSRVIVDRNALQQTDP